MDNKPEHITPQQFIDDNYAAKVPNECMVFVLNNSASVYAVELSKKSNKYFARHALFVSWLGEGELLRVKWEAPPPLKNNYVDQIEMARLIKSVNALQWDMSRDETLTLFEHIQETCRHIVMIKGN